MNLYKLKIYPNEFKAVKSGRKTFEYRKNERQYTVGDCLLLREWNPETKRFTGNEIIKKVNYILKGGQFGVPENYIIMSIV